MSVKDEFGDEIRKEEYYINGLCYELLYDTYVRDKYVLFFFDDYGFSSGYLSFGAQGYKADESYTATIKIKEENDNVVSFNVDGQTRSNGSFWNVLLSLDVFDVRQISEVFDRNEKVKIVISYGKKEEKSYNYGEVSCLGYTTEVHCIRNGHSPCWSIENDEYYYKCSVCDKALNTIGVVGPAGGSVFYDKGYYSDGWRYLEAAPADLRVLGGVPTVDSSINGYLDADREYVFGWYRTTDDGNNLYVNGTDTYTESDCTSTTVGTGKSNTEKLVAAMGTIAYSTYNGSSKTGNYAARLCDILTYTNGEVTYDDWFLPSLGELNALVLVLYSYENDSYWSSSEKQQRNRLRVVRDLLNNRTRYEEKSYRVRPIRDF